MVSGLTRGMETFATQRAGNDPDQYWVAILTLVNWICNVILPVYAGLQVAVGAMSLGMDHHFHPASKWMRHFATAGFCLMVSGLLRLGEFFVKQGTGGGTQMRYDNASRSHARGRKYVNTELR